MRNPPSRAATPAAPIMTNISVIVPVVGSLNKEELRDRLQELIETTIGITEQIAQELWSTIVIAQHETGHLEAFFRAPSRDIACLCAKHITGQLCLPTQMNSDSEIFYAMILGMGGQATETPALYRPATKRRNCLNLVELNQHIHQKLFRHLHKHSICAALRLASTNKLIRYNLYHQWKAAVKCDLQERIWLLLHMERALQAAREDMQYHAVGPRHGMDRIVPPYSAQAFPTETEEVITVAGCVQAQMLDLEGWASGFRTNAQMPIRWITLLLRWLIPYSARPALSTRSFPTGQGRLGRCEVWGLTPLIPRLSAASTALRWGWPHIQSWATARALCAVILHYILPDVDFDRVADRLHVHKPSTHAPKAPPARQLPGDTEAIWLVHDLCSHCGWPTVPLNGWLCRCQRELQGAKPLHPDLRHGAAGLSYMSDQLHRATAHNGPGAHCHRRLQLADPTATTPERVLATAQQAGVWRAGMLLNVYIPSACLANCSAYETARRKAEVTMQVQPGHLPTFESHELLARHSLPPYTTLPEGWEQGEVPSFLKCNIPARYKSHPPMRPDPAGPGLLHPFKELLNHMLTRDQRTYAQQAHTEPSSPPPAGKSGAGCTGPPAPSTSATTPLSTSVRYQYMDHTWPPPPLTQDWSWPPVAQPQSSESTRTLTDDGDASSIENAPMDWEATAPIERTPSTRAAHPLMITSQEGRQPDCHGDLCPPLPILETETGEGPHTNHHGLGVSFCDGAFPAFPPGKSHKFPKQLRHMSARFPMRQDKHTPAKRHRAREIREDVKDSWDYCRRDDHVADPAETYQGKSKQALGGGMNPRYNKTV